ncbi:unnamed protein product [Phaeothamnion confervicola]
MLSGADSPPEAIRQEKAALRKAILARRGAVDADSRSRHSQTITQKVCALPGYRAAHVVAAYASFGSEFDTSAFVADILGAGKQLLLPRINFVFHSLELRHVVDPGADLVAGLWGIREPALHCPVISPIAVEFILVPGVAFTVAGARLGYGGGYYDGLLGELSPVVPRIAAAFELQLVDRIPEGPRDRRVDRVVTET